MAGTTIWLTDAMRRTPPQITANVAAAVIAPVHAGAMSKLLSRAMAIVLHCTPLKARANVVVMSMAKSTAHGRLPSPRLI